MQRNASPSGADGVLGWAKSALALIRGGRPRRPDTIPITVNKAKKSGAENKLRFVNSTPPKPTIYTQWVSVAIAAPSPVPKKLDSQPRATDTWPVPNET